MSRLMAHAAKRQPRCLGRSLRRIGAGGAIVALGVGLVALGSLEATASASPADRPVASAAATVTLDGEGTWDVDAELTGWENDLYGGGHGLSLHYVEESGQFGRTDLLNGIVDYAIAGAPYTASELQGYSGGASGIIASPVMPSAVGFLLNPPEGGFTIQNGQTLDYSAPYTGQVREPVANVASQLLHYVGNEAIDPAGPYNPKPGTSSLAYSEWDNPDIVSNWDPAFLSQYNPSGGDNFEPNGEAGAMDSQPQQVIQAQPSEDNFYLDEWVQEQDPGFWSDLQQASGDPSTFTPSEQVQSNLSVTERPGLDEVLQTVESATQPIGSLTGHSDTAGVITDVPPAALQEATAAETTSQASTPGLGEEWVAVQNELGQWETPTPQSIDAAIDATPTPTPTATGGATPLYASTAPVPGGYPLTYVDYLYAPAKGLSVAKTEAMATVMRYLVTDGQGELAGHGDGSLSPTLVGQGLAAANHLVESDCPAAGGQIVVTSAPGPYDPDLPGLRSLGPVDHCEPGPTTSPTTTTTVKKATASTSTTVARTTTTVARSVTAPSSGSTGRSGSSAPTSPVVSAPTTTPPSSAASVPSTTATTKPKINAQLISALPLPVSDGTAGGLDKIGALLVGVGLFLLLRRPVAGWLHKLLRS